MAWFAIAPILISTFSLLISLGGFLYTVRSFSVTHRPYLGVVDSQYQLVETPPRAIVWKLILKNTGSKPAILKIDEYKATLSKQNKITILPSLGSLSDTISYVMPGESIVLLGQYTEVGGVVKMEEILNGSIFLDINMKLSYSGKNATGKSKYYYSSQIRFHAIEGFPASFATVKAEGN